MNECKVNFVEMNNYVVYVSYKFSMEFVRCGNVGVDIKTLGTGRPICRSVSHTRDTPAGCHAGLDISR